MVRKYRWSGSQLTTPTDSTSSTNSDWVQFLTGPIQAPTNANSAKARLILIAKTAGQATDAYFDDIVFEEAVASPPTPTDTPAPPISTPRPTLLSPTGKPTVSPAISIKALPSFPSSAASSYGAVLGIASGNVPTSKNKPTLIGSEPTLIAAQADHKKTEIPWVPLIFILVGFGLLGSCGILIALQTEKGKILWKRFF